MKIVTLKFWATFSAVLFAAALGFGLVALPELLDGGWTGDRPWWPWFLGAAALYAASAGLLLGWLAARELGRVTGALAALNDQLDEIGPGGLDRRLQVDSKDPEFLALQEKVNDLLARLSLNVHQLQRYSAQVAHELRSPLTIIRLKIEQAADKIDPALAEEVQTELLRLTMHVEQALLIARAEQGHLKPNRVRFDLAALVEDVAQDFRLLARDQGRAVELGVEPAMIDADPKYTKQMLYNLLSNSLRHGAGPIRVRLIRTAGAVRLNIANDLKPEGHEDLFDLGLGRRIVAALAALQQNMKVEAHRDQDCYEVMLEVTEPAAAADEAGRG